jgi:hypothetical protein
MASANVGHRHRRKLDSSSRQYFTKWLEAMPLTNVSSITIKKFFCQNIICQYGVPRHITVDNANYFDNAMFKEFC